MNVLKLSMLSLLTVCLIGVSGCTFIEDVGTVVEKGGEALKKQARYRQGQNKNQDSQSVSGSAPQSKNKYDPTLKEAQRLLANLGYSPGPADGLMGNRTRRAIKKFQTSNGLFATGNLNDRTFSALKKAKRSSVAKKTSPSKSPEKTTERLNSEKEVVLENSPSIENTDSESNKEQATEKKQQQSKMANTIEDTELKAGPDVFSNTVMSLRKGKRIEVTETTGSWVKAKVDGKSGYVFGELIRY